MNKMRSLTKRKKSLKTTEQLKNIINKMKNAIGSFNSRLDQAEKFSNSKTQLFVII